MFLANLIFNFHSGISITTTFLLVNVYLMQNMKKNPLKYQFLCFFENIGPKFGPNFDPKTTPTLKMKRGHYGPRPWWKKNFFGRNNKSRSSAFRKFLFYQNIICFDWVMNLFLSWVMFSVKKVSFSAKTAVKKSSNFVPKLQKIDQSYTP